MPLCVVQAECFKMKMSVLSVKSGFVSREHSEQLSALYVKSGIEIKSVFRAVGTTANGFIFDIRCPNCPGGYMITNYLFLNRELLDDVYEARGSILVVMRKRTDCVNFFNEIQSRYQTQTGTVICSLADLSVASKASKVTVRVLKDPQDCEYIKGELYTRIFCVGQYYDDEMQFLQDCLFGRNRLTK